MKLTALFVTLFCLHVSATVYSQISLRGKNLPLTQVFSTLQQQSGYSFFYNQKLVDNIKVSPDLENVSLKAALDNVLQDQQLSYDIIDKTVVIKQKEENFLERLKDQVKAGLQQVTVTASVHDELGNPMPGVNVRVKGTQNGTATDSKGNFSINVPDNNSILVFTYIGYETQELTAKNILAGSVITLKVAENNLQEVVISKGYYDEKRALSTGDVSVVSAKTIEEQPVSDPIQALIGRVPGLDIQQTSGIPGSYSTILIRGQNSLSNGNDPLYIIDGVPVNSQSLTNSEIGGGAVGQPGGVSNFIGGSKPGQGLSPFNALNPSDIESIEVLKDADATAIYGSRGANGVVIITTKKGKTGDTRFNFNAQQGYSQVGHFMDLLNTPQYLAVRDQAFANDGLTVPSIAANPSDNNYDVDGLWNTASYTNWQKVLIGGNAEFTDIQGSLSGGNSNTQFLVGGGYTRQTTVYPGNYADTKGSFHVSLTHVSSDQKLHAEFTANYVNDNSDIPQLDLTSQIILPPDAPPLYNKDGSLNWALYQGSSTFNNPLANTLAQANAVTNNLISHLSISYELLPGLQLKGSFGYTHEEMDQNLLNPATVQPPPYNTDPNARSNFFANTSEQNWIVEPQLSYRKRIAKGQFDAVIGSTFQQNTTNSVSQLAYGFASDALISDPLSASNEQIESDSYVEYRYIALYARIGYNWKEKYLLNITARRDGSSRFGPDKQFGNFGAIGAGWIFSKENSIQNSLPWLSFGKLRASYGVTGNDQITDYQFLSTYTPNSNTYQGITTIQPTSLTNPDFRWEIDKKLEVGLDLGLFKDRINLSADYYRNRSGNQLVTEPLPYLTGFVSVEFNLPAVVQNSGLEFSANSVNIKSRDFSWSTGFSLTLPYNKLVSFPDIANYPFYNDIYTVGQSLFIKKVFNYTGVNPQSGLYTFTTQNASGYPSTPQDLISSPPITRKYYGGVQNSFTYKGFRLDIFVQFVSQLGYNYQNYFTDPAGFAYNEPTEVLSAWKQAGEQANVQRFGQTNTVYNSYTYLQGSDGVLTSTSFVRLKNVSLSYNLPSDWQHWAHLQNGRIFLQGQNLLTLTKYIGLDPETQGFALPPLRTITVGLSGSF